MIRRYIHILHILLLLLLSACVNDSPPPVTSTTLPPTSTPTALPPTSTPATTPTPLPQPERHRPLLMAHYMPWYQTREASGHWGWHWTMDHFDADEGEIASHYHPLIGAYDSRDDDLLEYHILLMKLSGIDGVLVDWYGMERFWDYGLINASTNKLFQAIQNAGLLFAIVYEDQTVGHMVDNSHLESSQAVTHGQEVMLYMQEHWFQEPAYLRVDGQPVLLTFGPQFYKQADEWEDMFAVLTERPLFITLDNHGERFADASYPWPPMWASYSGVLSPEALADYLDGFYQKAENWDYLVAGAFPGFHDIYKQAGVGDGYGYLDAHDGETFSFTLQTALDSDPDLIQLITWNDFGEGTIIEPTTEFEYRYLEMVQDVQRSHINPNFPFTADDLTLPLHIFKLRKLYKGDEVVNGRLDQTALALLTNNVSQAKAILADYPLDEKSGH